MLYAFRQSREPAPVVKRSVQQPFTNRGLHVFRQRRLFSNVLDPDSYIEDAIFGGNTDVQTPEIEPIDVSRGGRDTVARLSGTSPPIPIPRTGGGGGGGGLTGSGTVNRIAKWAGTTSLTNSDLFEVISGGKRIGIGQAAPDPLSKLDVNGLIKGDTIRLVTGAATSRFWRATDALGNGSWQTMQLSDLTDGTTVLLRDGSRDLTADWDAGAATNKRITTGLLTIDPGTAGDLPEILKVKAGSFGDVVTILRSGTDVNATFNATNLAFNGFESWVCALFNQAGGGGALFTDPLVNGAKFEVTVGGTILLQALLSGSDLTLESGSAANILLKNGATAITGVLRGSATGQVKGSSQVADVHRSWTRKFL